MAVLALVLCFWHAWGRRDALVFLGTGVVYGVLLEWLVVLRFERYHYNASDFLLTIADVPLVIGFGWAAIIYSGVEVARQFTLSRRVVPLFVALFALHIDLAIDTVAIRIPFWTWTPPGVWFGVPLGNFVGWFLVATLFPASWLWLSKRVSNRVIRGSAAIVMAVLGLVVLLEAWTVLATTLSRKVIILSGTIAISLWFVSRDATLPSKPLDDRVVAVPVLYHGFYLAVLLGFGMYRETPAILGISLTMLALTAGLHRIAGDSVGISGNLPVK